MELYDTLKSYDQDHLLTYWNDLSAKEQSQLTQDIKKININELNGYVTRALAPVNNGHSNNIDQKMKPIPSEHFGSATDMNDENAKRWEVLGLEEISHDRIAVVLLAGGQGTRLGVKYPKGMYNVGLPSGKTLYQLQAERIRRLEQLAFEKTGKKGVIAWYIMTSEATKQQTLDFFEQHSYFGLDKNNVILFEQFTLPCVDFNKKIILAAKNKIATAPDGNGGLYRALREHGVLDDMSRRGVRATHVYCVDNILVKMADPVFVGFCREKGADCGAKVVEKNHPDEAVGVVCLVDNVYQVVEYSEITSETARLRTESGKLTFSAGNICNHFFTLDFLKNVCSLEQESQLYHHVAKKKIPYLNKDGKTVTPSTPNGIKMEKFVFDVFKFSERFAVLEVKREDEFSPLKNADKPDGIGGDSNPRTSRWALMSLHHRLIASAGGQIADQSGKVITVEESCSNTEREYPVQVEISPLLSYAGEGLDNMVRNKTLPSPVHLTLQQ
uniref:UDP-N-acetylhexosamine pyrophosphorylase-like n=1 Tax=Styela clava TaxID=7725 RepID=UPI001939E7AC|nr:UDP-N-acetylhexosamine pyrophosphorylase-like [Styela clava]